MITHHNFKDDIQAPPITQPSLIDATRINQVLIALNGDSKRFPEVQKFIVGYEILQMLAKTICYYKIKLKGCDLSNFGSLDVNKDWRKLIVVLIFNEDAPNLSCDITDFSEDIDIDLLNFYDHASNWKSTLHRDALITLIVGIHGDKMFGSY